MEKKNYENSIMSGPELDLANKVEKDMCGCEIATNIWREYLLQLFLLPYHDYYALLLSKSSLYWHTAHEEDYENISLLINALYMTFGHCHLHPVIDTELLDV